VEVGGASASFVVCRDGWRGVVESTAGTGPYRAAYRRMLESGIALIGPRHQYYDRKDVGMVYGLAGASIGAVWSDMLYFGDCLMGWY